MSEENIGLDKIASKIVKIMNDVSYVQKTGRNNYQGYNYASEADVSEVVRKAMVKHNVAIFPSVLTVEETPKMGSKEDSILTSITVAYTVVDGDSGQSIVCNGAGHSMDKLDKGIYQSLTGANKYFLMKLLQIPTGDDPEARDPETGKQTDKAPPKAKPETPKPASTPDGKPDSNKATPNGAMPATPGQIKLITDLLNELADTEKNTGYKERCDKWLKSETVNQKKAQIWIDALKGAEKKAHKPKDDLPFN